MEDTYIIIEYDIIYNDIILYIMPYCTDADQGDENERQQAQTHIFCYILILSYNMIWYIKLYHTDADQGDQNEREQVTLYYKIIIYDRVIKYNNIVIEYDIIYYIYNIILYSCRSRRSKWKRARNIIL